MRCCNSSTRSVGVMSSDTCTPRPHVKRIVKLGGAAITIKPSYETLNADILSECCKQISRVVAAKAPGEGADTIVVHGAGSYGHFQASEYGVARGNVGDARTREGFARTRLSVVQLSQHVVSALLQEGVAAVSLSPCAGWMTNGRSEVVQHGCEMVAAVLQAGLLPILHGDAVLDQALGCTILSGDTIIRQLAQWFNPDFVLFLSNVDGIFDRPPEEERAQLLRRIDVQPDGSWCVVGLQGELQLRSASHDVTGGIETKVLEAVNIAVLGVPVMLAKAGTEDADLACLHGLAAVGMTRSDGGVWRGTVVQMVDSQE